MAAMAAMAAALSSSVMQRAAAGAYDVMMHPLERLRLRRIRESLIGRARGRVLEIGAGSGVNIRYYRPGRVQALTLSDRSDREIVYRRRLRRHLGDGGEIPLTIARIDAQQLPFPDESFDTVVGTLLFCSVQCAPCGFDEIARVLRPGGCYLFLEHVRPVQKTFGRFADWINPVWNRVSGGCNLNRDTVRTMRGAGFSVQQDAHGNGVFVWGEAKPVRPV
jgi:ubiquinone/menaquinone biosynthesis C-methylase UbiE